MTTLLQSILSNSPDPCVVLKPVRDGGRIVDFEYVGANSAACEYNEMTYEDIIGQRLLVLLPAHVETGLFDRYVQVVESGVGFIETDLSFPKGKQNRPFHHFEVLAACIDGNLVLRFRDFSVQHDQAVNLAESERRYRVLAEHATDVVAELDADGVVLWVSPSVHDMLGWKPDEVIGRRSLDFIAAEDHPLILAGRRQVLENAQQVDHLECRLTTVSGEGRWMVIHSQPIIGDTGAVIGSVVGLRDVQHEVVLRRAVSTLSAANAILVRAEDEMQLLREMCEVPVRAGGYLFAWYARPLHDEAKTVVPVASADVHREYLDQIQIRWDDGPLGQGPTGRCLRTGEPCLVPDFQLAEEFAPWRVAAAARGFRSSLALPVFVGEAIDGALMVYAPEPRAFDDQAMTVMKDLASQIGYGLGRLRDAVRLAAALEDRQLLAIAIDQAAEAIVVTDTAPAIRYANPSAERSTGYSLAEMLGNNPSIFQSGLHDEHFYEEMWARLLGGRTWRGLLVNRRKNGEFFEEDASITPVHDDRGVRVAYVAVKHDLTRERSLEAAMTRHQLDRDAIVAVLRDVRPSENVGSTASSLCRSMRQFDGIDGTMVILLDSSGGAVPVAADGPMPLRQAGGQAGGSQLGPDQLDRLLATSTTGPWWVDLLDPDERAGADTEFAALMLAEGFTASAYAPIRWEGETVGVLAVATMAAEAANWMPTRLSVLAELGSLAGMLLGPQLAVHGRHESMRAEILDIIQHERFHVIFEPVIHLQSGSTVGFEALTRFDDGTPPDRRFEIADSVGLSSALEAACARTALRAATSLPDGAWVGVNFSPAALIDGSAADALGRAGRPVVVEITEHNKIDNYAAVRHAIEACGNIRIAVDDAGAGFASLRHILELQPDIIKLDLALVRGIDTDPARQALAAGLRHFAALTGTTLAAEGVETFAEATMVRQLGVELAQGFLFAGGSPLPWPE